MKCISNNCRSRSMHRPDGFHPEPSYVLLLLDVVNLCLKCTPTSRQVIPRSRHLCERRIQDNRAQTRHAVAQDQRRTTVRASRPAGTAAMAADGSIAARGGAPRPAAGFGLEATRRIDANFFQVFEITEFTQSNLGTIYIQDTPILLRQRKPAP